MTRANIHRRPHPTLRSWRLAHDLSQADAARLLGISLKSYSRFELGQRFVKGELASRLMDQTGVPLEVLAGVV